jgi:hypothetical protein
MAQAFRGAVLFVGVLLVAGCGRAAPPELGTDEIRQQWNQNIKRLGFGFVLYPPTEDIQVGDVYAFDGRTDGELKAAKEKRSPSRRIDRVDLRDRLTAFYRSRLALPKTAALGGDDIRPQQTDPGLFVPLAAAPDRASTLALVGFDLAAVSTRHAGLSLPLGFLGIGASGSQQGSATVRLRASGVETYGVLDYQAVQALKEYCRGERRGIEPKDKPCHAATVAELLMAMNGDRSCRTGVLMVTRVILVRQIDYIIESADGFAVGADVSLTLAKAVAAQKELAELLKTSSGRDGADSAAPGGAQAGAASPAGAKDGPSTPAAEQIKSLNAEISRNLADLRSRLAPGGAFSVSEANSREIRLSQVFERPLAIAYDGPAFETKDRAACEPPKGKVEW